MVKVIWLGLPRSKVRITPRAQVFAPINKKISYSPGIEFAACGLKAICSTLVRWCLRLWHALFKFDFKLNIILGCRSWERNAILLFFSGLLFLLIKVLHSIFVFYNCWQVSRGDKSNALIFCNFSLIANLSYFCPAVPALTLIQTIE